jgi:hypothetical protein
VIKITNISTKSFEKKLASYAIAGAAALAAPATAQAGIIFVTVDTTVNQPGNLTLDLSGPSNHDLTISALNENNMYVSHASNRVRVETGAGAQVMTGMFAEPTAQALAFGAIIDPLSGTWGNGGKMADWDTVWHTSFGTWPVNGSTAYLGFYFQGVGGPQAGWAEIQTTANDSTSSFRLVGYAYQEDANVSIMAGELSPAAPVPEPSSIALIALGGAGLLALRRRRSANA